MGKYHKVQCADGSLFGLSRHLFTKKDKLIQTNTDLPRAMILCSDIGKGWHLITSYQWATCAHLWKNAKSLEDLKIELYASYWQWVMGLFMQEDGHVDVLASCNVTYTGSPYGRGMILGSGEEKPTLILDGRGYCWEKRYNNGEYDGLSLYIAENQHGPNEFVTIKHTSSNHLVLNPGSTPGNGKATFCILRHYPIDITEQADSGEYISTLWEDDDLSRFAIPKNTSGTPNQEYGSDIFWYFKDKMRAALRGGHFTYGANAGVFALDLNYFPSDSDFSLGFRAAKAL